MEISAIATHRAVTTGEDFFSHNPNPDAVLQFLCHIAQGLRWMHAKGVVHRDIKPQNILLRTTDKINPITGELMEFAALTDFGFTRETKDLRGKANALRRGYLIVDPSIMSFKMLTNADRHEYSQNLLLHGTPFFCQTRSRDDLLNRDFNYKADDVFTLGSTMKYLVLKHGLKTGWITHPTLTAQSLYVRANEGTVKSLIKVFGAENHFLRRMRWYFQATCGLEQSIANRLAHTIDFMTHVDPNQRPTIDQVAGILKRAHDILTAAARQRQQQLLLADQERMRQNKFLRAQANHARNNRFQQQCRGQTQNFPLQRHPQPVGRWRQRQPIRAY